MKWLVIDSHFLCHRAFHSAGHLSFKGIATGVIFQFLKTIGELKDQFDTDNVAFCFEHKRLFRRDIYPAYKERRRRERTEEEVKAYAELARQIGELRDVLLPKIGFKNVFHFEGMESDDIMARLALTISQEVILVTADADLWQCLSPTASIWNPQKQKLLTDVWFQKTYGFKPSKWALVKAIAGCNGDDVPGVDGVGEITACKFVRGELKETSSTYKSITSPCGKALVWRNRDLVKLPLRACPSPNLVKDEIDAKAWREVCGRFGMKSLAGRPPIAMRKARRG